MTNYFDASDSIERGFEMKVRDMTSTDTQIRPIRQGTVAAYLGEMEKWTDNHVNKFQKYVRLACNVGFFLVRFECRTEMKKSISYKMDVQVNFYISNLMGLQINFEISERSRNRSLKS